MQSHISDAILWNERRIADFCMNHDFSSHNIDSLSHAYYAARLDQMIDKKIF